jgi:hypothetical protein
MYIRIFPQCTQTEPYYIRKSNMWTILYVVLVRSWLGLLHCVVFPLYLTAVCLCRKGNDHRAASIVACTTIYIIPCGVGYLHVNLMGSGLAPRGIHSYTACVEVFPMRNAVTWKNLTFCRRYVKVYIKGLMLYTRNTLTTVQYWNVQTYLINIRYACTHVRCIRGTFPAW